MKKIFLLITLGFSIVSNAQEAKIFKIKKFRVAALSNIIDETSGLSFFNGKLYTFNDSGNPAELYEIDKSSGKILNTLKVNAENKDWEALTNDGKNFYIGDFGNNAGARKDLKIYKVPFKNNQLLNDSLKTISFYYPEQQDFSSKDTKTNFDLESMIYLNEKIHVFTKEWDLKSTTHYVIDPENYENQPAKKIETHKTGFVVTDAYYYDKKLFIVGYTKKTEVFLDIYKETEPGIFFKENPKHLYLGSALTIGQIEGVAVDSKGVYISGEKFNSSVKKTKPYLYFIPMEKLKGKK